MDVCRQIFVYLCNPSQGINKDLDCRCRIVGCHGRSSTGSDYHPPNLQPYSSTVPDVQSGTSAPDVAAHKSPCNDACLCIDWDNYDTVTESCSPLPAFSGGSLPWLGNTGEPCVGANVPKTKPSNNRAKKVPFPFCPPYLHRATEEKAGLKIRMTG